MTDQSSALPEAAPAGDKKESFKINYHGREYRIYREPYQQNWRMRVVRKGQPFAKSLDTPIRSVAIKQAKVFLDSLFSDTWEEKLEALRCKNRGQSKIGELVDLYLAQAPAEIGIKPKVARSNARCLLNVLATLFPDKTPRDLFVYVLTDEAIRDYIRQARKNGNVDASIRSALAQARSMVTPKLKHLYEKELQVPKGIFTLNWSAHNLDTGTTGFVPFPDGVAQAMEKAAMELPPNVRRAYHLMARLGCRNIEASHVRRTWFETHDGQRLIVFKDRPEEDFLLKNSLPGSLPVDDALWDLLTSDLEEDAVFLVNESTMTKRKLIVERALNQFVRRFLPDRVKGAYELRKWAGSIVATRTQNIYLAQIFLRHRSVKTTESFYATFLSKAPSVGNSDLAALYPARVPAPVA